MIFISFTKQQKLGKKEVKIRKRKLFHEIPSTAVSAIHGGYILSRSLLIHLLKNAF